MLKKTILAGLISLLIATPAYSESDSVQMISIDQNALTAAQTGTFNNLTKDLRTDIGPRCSYYKKPQIWCLLKRSNAEAQQIYQTLKNAGLPVTIQTVRKLKGEKTPR